MLLSDSKIRELISSGVLTETRSENLGPVSYDLTTRAFHTRDQATREHSRESVAEEFSNSSRPKLGCASLFPRTSH